MHYLGRIDKVVPAIELTNRAGFEERVILVFGTLTVAGTRNNNLRFFHDRQHYAYQIINGNKQNPSRIKVLALCIACHMTLAEAQHALGISQNGILYPRVAFDAIVIYNLNLGNWSVCAINEQLHAEGLPVIE